MGADAFSRIRDVARRLGRPSLRLGAAIAVAGAFAGSAAAQMCADPAERDALTVRTLQTRLMVAALTCDVRADYNDFVIRFRPMLAVHGGKMKKYFRRAYGNGSPGALNAYVTELANQASALSIADRPAYCQASREAFAALVAAPAHARSKALIEVAMRPGPARDVPPACDALTRR